MPVIASRSDLVIMIVLAALLLLAPVVPGYLYHSFRPVPDSDLTEVEGRLKYWKENSLGRPGDIQGGARRDLWIFLEGDDARYEVREDIYNAPWFDASGFKRAVPDGTPLTLIVTRQDLAAGQIREVYGLRTAGTVYLTADSTRADDLAFQRKMLYITAAMLLACPALAAFLIREIRRYLRNEQ